MNALAVEKLESAHVEIRNGESWIRLTIHLGEPFHGGQVIQFIPDAKYAIEGTDGLASSYGQKNWLSGLASGVFYSFRALQIPRRIVYVTEFTGRLRSAHMPAVAAAASCAVAACVGRDSLALDLEGWGFSPSAEPVPSSKPPASEPAIAE